MVDTIGILEDNIEDMRASQRQLSVEITRHVNKKSMLEQEIQELEELIKQLTQNHEKWEQDIEKILVDISVLKGVRNEQ